MSTTANVKVVIRIRPPTIQETLEVNSECVQVIGSNGNESGTKQCIIGKNHSFTFDDIFDASISQYDVFEKTTSPLINKFMEGYNVTIFAYGQTGSGKTYTMGTGIDGSMDSTNLGIVPRAIEEIFKNLKALYPDYCATSYMNNEARPYMIYSSFLEIYNEEVKDLLASQPSTLSSNGKNGGKQPHLVIREDASGEIYLAGCHEEEITNPEELFNVLRKGTLCRSTGSTDMNLTSSRSHAIFTLILRQKKMIGTEEGGTPALKNIVSKFNFVDLAGSERLKRTKAVGNRAKEAISINSGLLALGNVISVLGDLSKSKGHVPYRDSKLTRLLQNSLGGNSQTLMMACISPAECNYQESLNTLKYANRARNIQNRVSVNEDGAGSIFEIAQLKKQIMNLKQELLLLKSAGISSTSHSTNVTTNTTVANVNVAPGTNDSGTLPNYKLIKEKLEKKISELLSDNTNLKLKLDLMSSSSPEKIETLEHLLNSSQVIELTNTVNMLKGKVYMLEALRDGHLFPMHHNHYGTLTSPGGTHSPRRVKETRDRDDHALNIISKVKEELQQNIGILALPLNPDNEEDDDIAKLSKAELEAALRNVQTSLIEKQELVTVYERTKEDYHHMKAKYEEKLAFLQDTITNMKKEQLQTTTKQTLRPGTQLSKISRDKYEMRIQKLSKELEETKEKLSEYITNRAGKGTEVQIENYKSIISAQKLEKTRVISAMTEEMTKLRFMSNQRETEIKDLKLQLKEAQDEKRIFKKNWELSKTIIKKKSGQPFMKRPSLNGAQAKSLIGGLSSALIKSPRVKKNKSVSFNLPSSPPNDNLQKVISNSLDFLSENSSSSFSPPYVSSPSCTHADSTLSNEANLFPAPTPIQSYNNEDSTNTELENNNIDTVSVPLSIINISTSPKSMRKNAWILTRNDVVSALHVPHSNRRASDISMTE